MELKSHLILLQTMIRVGIINRMFFTVASLYWFALSVRWNVDLPQAIVDSEWTHFASSIIIAASFGCESLAHPIHIFPSTIALSPSTPMFIWHSVFHSAWSTSYLHCFEWDQEQFVGLAMAEETLGRSRKMFGRRCEQSFAKQEETGCGLSVPGCRSPYSLRWGKCKKTLYTLFQSAYWENYKIVAFLLFFLNCGIFVIYAKKYGNLIEG